MASPSDRHLLLPAGTRAVGKLRWFKEGQKWRAACEGRISVIKRRHRLARSRYQGLEGMPRGAELAVIADDLINIERYLAPLSA